jgi:ABC-2 type transport system ATP-binding protein
MSLAVATPTTRLVSPADASPAGEPAIRIRDLRKVYVVHERQAGLVASVRSLVRRQSREIAAVDRISFDVMPGEIVGFLGPNGAGKTTTLKMASGLLHPSAGEVSVLGHTPWKREKALLRQITLVMGQRNQLQWDIPAVDSFELNRAIYRLPHAEYRRTLSELTDLLDLDPLLGKPVRNLSLGERMKCEVAAALLHRPRVLFLDEPTIGLDVTMQRRIRTFIAEYNRRHGATVLLTSHYMADVEALCKRVVVIHHGRLLFDGDLARLVERFSPHKTIVVELEDGGAPTSLLMLREFGEVVSREDGRIALRVPKAQTPAVTGRILAQLPVTDLTVEDPPIEEVIEQVFSAGSDGATNGRD